MRQAAFGWYQRWNPIHKLHEMQMQPGTKSAPRRRHECEGTATCRNGGCKRWHMGLVISSRRIVLSPLLMWAEACKCARVHGQHAVC